MTGHGARPNVGPAPAGRHRVAAQPPRIEPVLQRRGRTVGPVQLLEARGWERPDSRRPKQERDYSWPIARPKTPVVEQGEVEFEVPRDHEMAGKPSSLVEETRNAAGFLLLGAWFGGLIWLQIQWIGPRWNDISLVLALIVALCLLRGFRHARAAMQAAAALRDH